MKNKLKLLLIITVLFMLIMPSTATIVNVDYESAIATGEITGTMAAGGDSSNTRDYPIHIRFPVIEEWKQVKALIYKFQLGGGTNYFWGVRDIGEHTSDIAVKYKIGGVEIGTGNMQFVRHLDGAGALSGGILSYTFDSGFDTDVIGNRIVEVVYPLITDTNLRLAHPGTSYTITSRSDNCPQLVAKGQAGTYTCYSMGMVAGIGYKYSVFHHNFNYDYNDISQNDIYLDFNRMGYTSNIVIIGESDILLSSETSSDDLYFDVLFDIPYNINITNPAYIGTGPGEYFEYDIPEDIEDADIAQLTYTVYNAGIPSQIISTYYNLKKYNTTGENWELQTSGFNSGTMEINIPNNLDYNMTLTKSGFTTKEHYFSVSGDTTKTVNMYPDYAGNYTVTFKIRAYSTGEYIEGAKIIANGETKYTPYNGNIGFGDIDGIITYEISKSGYVPISGNKTITENQAIFITLLTEEQALEPTITPTPTTTPDILQPTNIMESIQFAFQKMFGLSSSTEDTETSNLLMGLLIIFSGAALIAGITKDALGAVIGALIGFVMSLALGFIPLWVLFVGFASFAIYIILTKTGGSE